MGAFAKLHPGEQMVFSDGVSLTAIENTIRVEHWGNENSTSVLDGLYCIKDSEGNFLLSKGAEGCLAVFDESEV
jgi:hypothetical protein